MHKKIWLGNFANKKVKNNKGNAEQFLLHKSFKILQTDENVVSVMCEFIHWKEWTNVEPNGSLYILKAFNFIDL